MLRKSLGLLCAIMVLGSIAFGQPFVFQQEFTTDPDNSPYAIAADSSGGIYYATFEDASSRVVYVADPINNPSSQVVVTTAIGFPLWRGLQGIAVDSSGNVYVSGDTGSATWVEKFGPAPTFTPDAGFTIGSTSRLGGCDLLSDSVLGCVSWDGIQFFNTSNGTQIAAITGGTNYQRDLAFNSSNNDLYAAYNTAPPDTNSCSLWSGGTPASPASYSFIKNDLVTIGSIASLGSQGIEYDARNGRLLIANKLSQGLDIYTISGSGAGTLVSLFQSIDGADSTGGAIGSIGDSVTIDKGTYALLFITDMVGTDDPGRILVYSDEIPEIGTNVSQGQWSLYY